MTNKIQAVIAASLTGLFGFINWLCTLPPEQQAGMAGALVELVPLDWRPVVGVWTRLFMFFGGIFVAFKASKSGPTQPPTI